MAHAEAFDRQLTGMEAGAAMGRPTGASAAASSWTLGQKRLLFIRADFPDLPGTPFLDDVGTSLISSLNAFYTDMSYGQAGFALKGAGSEVTPTLRLPQTAAWYGTNNDSDQLRADARDAAAAAGYVLTNFDLDLICFGSVPGFNWNGLANIGAAGAWLRNSFSFGVVAHELGHNFGLNHANLWETSGQSVIGSGTSVEYGDGFDNMGGGLNAGSQYHFNTSYKSYLHWLTTNDVSTVTESGIYRIYAQDDPLATGLRALRIPVMVPQLFPLPTTGSLNYWVEFRQQVTGNKWLLDGAGLRWGWNGNQSSLLLDTTVGSSEGKSDSSLVIGRTFSDAGAGIYITPIGKGGTSPESLDIVIKMGTFSSNVAPMLTVTADATNTEPGQPLTFEAAASDPDGDALAYYWDFGDGNYGTNGPSASHAWSNVGEYLLRCRVTDMRGGNASRSIVVRVGASATYRISGRVTKGGQPMENVRVFVSPIQMSYTDSDGTYTLAGLPGSNYIVNASLDQYALTPSAFSNPVRLGPNAVNIDFVATEVIYPPAIVTQPQGQTAQRGADVTFTVVAVGSPPLRYGWRFNGSIIDGATDTTYMRTNVQWFDQGSYAVIVSNLAGMVTSAGATLALRVPPLIVSQPESKIVNIGATAVFSVVAGGGGPTSPLQYQWFFNSTNLIYGATSNAFAITNVQDRDVGTYSAVVKNDGGETASSNALLIINHLPVAHADTVYRLPTNSVQIGIQILLSNDSDADGDLLAFHSFSTNSAHGGALSLENESLTYLPPTGFTNVDEFTYVIGDSRGGTATGTVTVAILPSPTLTINRLGNRSYLIRLEGIAGATYRLEYSDGLEHPFWQALGSSAANESGIVEWTDSPPVDSGSRFYRSLPP